MKTCLTKNGAVYLAAKCFGLKGLIIGGAKDAKATILAKTHTNLVAMVAVATKKNPGARPGFEFTSQEETSCYQPGGRHPAGTI